MANERAGGGGERNERHRVDKAEDNSSMGKVSEISKVFESQQAQCQHIHILEIVFNGFLQPLYKHSSITHTHTHSCTRTCTQSVCSGNLMGNYNRDIIRGVMVVRKSFPFFLLLLLLLLLLFFFAFRSTHPLRNVCRAVWIVCRFLTAAAAIAFKNSNQGLK